MRFLIFLTLGFVLASTAAAAPKPWQWTPAQARQAITSQEVRSLYVGKEDGVEPTVPWTLLRTSCRGLGKKVAGRYSAFRCPSVFAQRENRTVVVWAKVRRVSKPSLCLSTVSLARVPSGCLARGPRAPATIRDAQIVMQEKAGVAFNWYCRNHGSSFYSCVWFTGPHEDTVQHEGTVVFTPKGPVVKVLR